MSVIIPQHSAALAVDLPRTRRERSNRIEGDGACLVRAGRAKSVTGVTISTEYGSGK